MIKECTLEGIRMSQEVEGGASYLRIIKKSPTLCLLITFFESVLVKESVLRCTCFFDAHKEVRDPQTFKHSAKEKTIQRIKKDH